MLRFCIYPKIIWNPVAERALFRFVNQREQAEYELSSGIEGKNIDITEFILDITTIFMMAA